MPPSIINLNDATPAAPAGSANVKWQADTGSPRNVSAHLPVFTGDAGSGGAMGLVPAPAAGDAAAGKVLKADGTWAASATGFANPMTTEGDLIIGGVSGAPTRLSAGTVGQVLTSGGAGVEPSWAAGGGSGVTNIIYDDDCTNDPDAAVSTMPLLGRLYNTRQVNVLALINDSSNNFAAPAMRALANFYGMGDVPMGAWLGAVPSSNTNGNTSTWTSQLVAQFNPGDTRSNYTDAVTVYRTALAAAPTGSVTIVCTGFLTCISALMQSPADSISSLTGVQLIQAKVSQIYVMGGYEPSTGSNEFNFQNDAVSAQYVLANWTTASGYPPIYFSGVNNGATSVVSGISGSYPLTNPSAYVGSLTAYTRPSWDALTLCQAVFGTSTLSTISADGTNTITSTSGSGAGTNSFVTTSSSGHYYLTLSQTSAYYQYLLNSAISAQGPNGVRVDTLNGLAGPVTVVAGANIRVSTSGGTITVSSPSTSTHDENLTDGQGNIIFANGDVIMVVGVTN
jgi:hypothetical protein